jgi:peptidoglycan/LPS O-acetylase OafA/YrhL
VLLLVLYYRLMRVRLHSLDGLRGLAALYVVIYHAALNSEEAPGTFSPTMSVLHALIDHGHFAVVFFIVLSGFSLMLPVARESSKALNGGLKEFVKRRARRILPTYYAALAASLLLIGSYYVLEPFLRLSRPKIEHVFETGNILSHLALVHNFSFAWVYKINAPMWSVATEWQIYFVFALVLLPLWRRFGIVLVVFVAWFLGCLPHALLAPNENLWWAGPWLLGSFSLGMLGASIHFSPEYANSWWRKRAPWGLFAVIAAGLTALVRGRPESWNHIAVDACVSVCALCIINRCVVDSNSPEGSGAWSRLFGSKLLVALGGFSYSLYLIQHPILTIAKNLLNKLRVERDAHLQLELLVAVPITLALAWLFAELFERPFTSGGVLLPALRRRLGAAAESPKPAPQQV